MVFSAVDRFRYILITTVPLFSEKSPWRWPHKWPEISWAPQSNKSTSIKLKCICWSLEHSMHGTVLLILDLLYLITLEIRHMWKVRSFFSAETSPTSIYFWEILISNLGTSEGCPVPPVKIPRYKRILGVKVASCHIPSNSLSTTGKHH